MNEFYDAIYESSLDNISMLQDRLNADSKIVQADDCIKIIAPVKKQNGRYLSVTDDYITTMLDSGVCNRTITGYRHIQTGVYFAKNDLSVKANRDLYTPVYQLTVKHDSNTTIVYNRNNISICIYKLEHFTKSRYNALINVLIESNIFLHKTRKESPTKKREYNNNRNILRRDFKMHKYEWSFTLDCAISRAILPAIKRLSSYTENGYYILHASQYAQCSVKVYNISAIQPDRINQKYQFLPDDLLKVEITYNGEYFKSRPDLSIANFKLQTDAFFALQSDNMRIFKTKLLDKLRPVELKKVLTAANVTSKSQLISKLKESNTVQTRIDKQLAEIRNRIAALEKHKAENDAFKAETDARLDKIESIMDMHDAKKDQRKLRLV